jgi:hypothetical protein
VDSPLIGKQVRTAYGQEGTVLAVAYGGDGGWQLLILMDGRMVAASAHHARVLEPEGPVGGAMALDR